MLKSGLLLLVALGLAGCATFLGSGPAPVMAVAVDDADAEILYLCREDGLREVRVQQIDQSDAGIIAGPVLWHVRIGRSVDLQELTIGDPPAGSDEVVPLANPLPADKKISVVVTTSEGWTLTVDVRLANLLGSDEVRVPDGTMLREEFEGQDIDC
jgi:hypothetical protein